MAEAISSPSSPQIARPSPVKVWWVLLGAVLLPLIYLGTLSTRFDFIDDGNLVYPTRGLSFDQRIGVVWDKIVANVEHLGPFRPVLWCHWEIAADTLGGSEFGWRLTRLVWCGFATLMLLWLFAELRMAPVAALMAGAVAMWNPYRNEIWTSLTLAEGVAMPYALLALICAGRAPRSRRPWAWDLLGALCVLAALGCKNTFAALVPAQMFLRLAPDQLMLREGWRRYGRRALLLSLTLALPIGHFIWFKRHWHAGQYTTDGASLAQLRRIGSGLLGAMSLDFLGAGVALAVLAQVVACRKAGTDARSSSGRWAVTFWLAGLVNRHRAAFGAAALLLLGGIALYLPIGAMSGRYSMPAVWGLDLTLAAVLTGLTRLRPSNWTRLAWGALAVGLAVVMVANVGKQQKFAARACMLWEALEYVEREAPPNAQVAWISGDSLKDGLNVEEGVHFQWHLENRGRRDVRLGLYDEHGQPMPRLGQSELTGWPTLAIVGTTAAPAAADWQIEQRFVAAAWGGLRRYECYLLQPLEPTHTAQRSQRLGKHGITCSMSRRADCWDNAPMESFFASLKKELVHDADFATRAEARAALFEYIEVFYNVQRRHSSLGYVAPAEYEPSENS